MVIYTLKRDDIPSLSQWIKKKTDQTVGFLFGVDDEILKNLKKTFV